MIEERREFWYPLVGWLHGLTMLTPLSRTSIPLEEQLVLFAIRD